VNTFLEFLLFPYFLRFVTSKYIFGFCEFFFEVLASSLELCFFERECFMFSGKLIPFFRCLFDIPLHLSELFGFSGELCFESDFTFYEPSLIPFKKDQFFIKSPVVLFSGEEEDGVSDGDNEDYKEANDEGVHRRRWIFISL
jgi:hypothetical protein